MNLCRSPEHPHCTVWVMPGAAACVHGHAQPVLQTAVPPSPSNPPACTPSAPANGNPARAHLRVSGFDPRAAGGRQSIKLELRAMPADCPARLTMLVKSELHLYSPQQITLVRAASGDWRAAFLDFSSRALEHGQHRIELEIHERSGEASRAWVCSLVILIPRPDATLADIHRAFLSSHKNVRIFADDGSVARVNAKTAGGSVDIDVSARNAGIAKLDLDASAPGRIDVGLPTIAWDEDLVEIDSSCADAVHPYPTGAACLVHGAPAPGLPHYVRLFAAQEWVLGRFDAGAPEADVLLAHVPGTEAANDPLTRRLSARHALIRAGADGFVIEDVSRYGLLVDGEWPGKQRQVLLREGMRLDFTASVPGVATLEVSAVLPNALVLSRVDGGAATERFWLVVPGREPAPGDAVLPMLHHRDGGFWHRDPATGADTALTPSIVLARLGRMAPHARFAGGPYPEVWSVRTRVADRRRGRDGKQLH
jgi:hypothetical protein